MLSSGLIPCENILYATVSMSTLPVRSPLPKRVPSTLSAPARRASSVEATPSPLSLWGWMLNIMLSLFLKCVFIHSIWSAYTLGVVISTVDGRLMIMGFSLVAPQVSCTAVQISSAKSSSVPVKLSGEYSRRIWVSQSAIYRWTILVPMTAMSFISSLSLWNTTSLCKVDVEL